MGIIAIIVLASLAAGAAGADDPPPTEPTGSTAEERATTSGFAIFEDERLAGDWGGRRTELEEAGIEFNFGLTSVYQHVAHGGANTHNAHEITGSYDLEFGFDLGAMGVIPGGRVYVLAEGSWLDGLSDGGDVGDYFGVNGDAGGDRAVDVTELWYEQSFFDARLTVTFGKIDLSAYFETNAYANDETYQFLNNALINSGNVPFPENGLGIALLATPCAWFYFGAGLADAEADARETGLNTAFHGADDFFSVYEVGFTPSWDLGRGELPGSYRVGMWYDPRSKERFFNDLGGRRRHVPSRRDDVGFYLSLDQTVYVENPKEVGDAQGLGVFLRYSFAHDDVNEIDHFWSAGGQYQGLLPTRDADVLGLGIAQGHFSNRIGLTGDEPSRETVIELYYNAEVLPWLHVTPDFQWIVNPGGEGVTDAFVAGLRWQMAF
ncbi:MAG TPA: carbohydrate porin [Phycisphaerae bacterium]|nr:carbohydrate porin [Phycisphaerae bacterium]